MVEENGNSGGSDGGGSNDTKITIEIDGESKEFGAEDISNLIAQQAAATQMSQKLAPITKVLEKYDTDAGTFLEQAEGAFVVTRKVIEAGLIEEKTGELIQKVEPVKPDHTTLPGFPTQVDSTQKTAEIIGKALKPLQDKMDMMEREQLHILRADTSREVKSKYPDFTEDDVSRLFATAANDHTKTLYEHADVLSKGNTSKHEEMEVAFAKKYGIDLEVARNKLKEQDDGGGGSVTVFEGKKFSFKKGPGSMNDKDAVTPADAMQAHMKKALTKE